MSFSDYDVIFMICAVFLFSRIYQRSTFRNPVISLIPNILLINVCLPAGIEVVTLISESVATAATVVVTCPAVSSVVSTTLNPATNPNCLHSIDKCMLTNWG